MPKHKQACWWYEQAAKKLRFRTGCGGRVSNGNWVTFYETEQYLESVIKLNERVYLLNINVYLHSYYLET